MVDDQYLTNGIVEECIKLVDDYVNKLEIVGLTRKVFQPEGKTPLIVYVVDGQGSDANVMLYGHLDKQPWMNGWDEGLGPITPVIRDGFLYGRGGADDGYSVFSVMLAIKNLQLQGCKIPRCALVLETEEESGSPNLIALLEVAKEFIGKPDFMFCMDSGAFDYKSMWLTSSLRGICILDVTINAAKGGFHSGLVGGIVPETFRVLRELLDRIDDSKTGHCAADLQTEIPEWALKEAESMAALAGDALYKDFPVEDGVKYVHQDNLVELYLNSTWRPNLAITGASGLPEVAKAGNVLRPSTTLRLSLRLPPNADPHHAQEVFLKKVSENIPYGCKATIKSGHTGQGWCMKDPEPWVKEAFNNVGTEFFDGNKPGSYGMGGSIPFLAELGKMYPETAIYALGVLGPKANAHAPNECINLDYTKRITCALSHLIAHVGAH